jgi:hypothetical protein
MKGWGLLATLVAVVLDGQAVAKDRAEMTPDDILECVEASGPQKSSVQSGRMRVEAASGSVRESKAKVWWARFDDLSNLLVRFSAPEELRGSSLLVLEKPDELTEIFMYLPEFHRVKRVNSRMMSGSVFGTDFSYEDVERLYRLATDLTSRRLEDSKLAGRDVFVVESLPSPDSDSSYERIVETIEQEHCVVLKLEFFERGGEPRKVITVDPEHIREVGGVWIPHELQIVDLSDGSRTTIVVDKIDVNADLSKGIFSQGRLSRGN